MSNLDHYLWNHIHTKFSIFLSSIMTNNMKHLKQCCSLRRVSLFQIWARTVFNKNKTSLSSIWISKHNFMSLLVSSAISNLKYDTLNPNYVMVQTVQKSKKLCLTMIYHSDLIKTLFIYLIRNRTTKGSTVK